MRRLLVAVVLLASCSVATPKLAPTELRFHLEVMPAVTQGGQSAWLRCFVPELLGDGDLRLALDGWRATGPARVEHIQNDLLIEHVPCGSWTASCRFVGADGRMLHDERTLEGVCD